MKDWAKWYANNGWPVFPVFGVDDDGVCRCYEGVECSDPGKHPIIPYKEGATTSGLEAELQWNEHPDANIGLHCSKFTVVDLDNEGVSEFKRLRVKYNDMSPPLTPTVKTRRGFHMYFKHLEGIRNCAGLKISEDETIPGIDIRTTGGYIVAPPSVHSSGHQYEWVQGRHPTEVPLAEMPAWLAWFLRKDFHGAKKAATAQKKFEPLKFDPAFWQGKEFLKQKEGGNGRNPELAKAAGKLFYIISGGKKVPYADVYGEVEDALLQVNEICCKPPKSEREVRKVVQSVARYG